MLRRQKTLARLHEELRTIALFDRVHEVNSARPVPICLPSAILMSMPIQHGRIRQTGESAATLSLRQAGLTETLRRVRHCRWPTSGHRVIL
jgi:hypothetical protein